MLMSWKLKVAIFNTQPPHLYFGGVERRIVEVAKRLVNDFETTVYSGTKKGFKETTMIDGITFVPCFSTDRIYPLDNWVFNRSVSRMVDTIRADIYEAHTVSGYKFLKRLRKLNSSKPFIQTVHGVLADEQIQSTKSVSPSIRMKLSTFFMGRLAKIEKEAANEANLIVTVSQYSLEKLIQLYEVDETKIRVVPNGVDTQKFKPAENCEGIKDIIGGRSENVVLFVGNLIPRKGLHYLIEAAKNVVKEMKKNKVCGCWRWATQKQPDCIYKRTGCRGQFRFLGQCSRRFSSQIIQLLGCFCFPVNSGGTRHHIFRGSSHGQTCCCLQRYGHKGSR